MLDLAGGSRLAGEATGLSNNAGTDNLEKFKVSKAFKIFLAVMIVREELVIESTESDRMELSGGF